MLVPQLAEHVFVGQSTIGISLLKLETPYADPHVRCCERCDAKTSAYSIYARSSRANAQLGSIRQKGFSPCRRLLGTPRATRFLALFPFGSCYFHTLLVWPFLNTLLSTMASADFPPFVVTAASAVGGTSSGKNTDFHSITAVFTSVASVWLLDFTLFGTLVRHRGLRRFLFVGPEICYRFFQLSDCSDHLAFL